MDEEKRMDEGKRVEKPVDAGKPVEKPVDAGKPVEKPVDAGKPVEKSADEGKRVAGPDKKLMDNIKPMDILGTLASAILSANSGADAERKADFDAVAKAVQKIKIPDLQQLAALKTQLEGMSKEGGMPLNVQGALTLILQNLKGLDANSQESGVKIWETLKPIIGNADALSLLAKSFGQYGGRLMDILKAVFVRANPKA